MTTPVEFIRKFHLVNILAFAVGGILVALLGWLVVLQLGFLTKQVSIPPEAQEIERQAEFIERYPLTDESKRLQQIVPPARTLEITPLAPEEIGKGGPFD